VEENYAEKPAAKLIAEDYLSEFRTKNIDTLILGCTNYPLLKGLIGSVIGEKVRLVDSAESTANSAKEALTELGLLNPIASEGKRSFYVSDSPAKFKQIARQFLGKRISKVELVDINSY
jgi:glutamate racemase